MNNILIEDDIYFNNLFEDYKSLLTTTQREEYLRKKLKESLGQQRHELSLFIAGFLDLERGRIADGLSHFNDNILKNKKYKLLGLAIAYYLQAQREYNEKLCAQSLRKLEELIESYPELVKLNWFIQYKLGKVYCLAGDLHEKNNNHHDNNKLIACCKGAVDSFNAVIDMDETLPHPWNALGDLFLKRFSQIVMDYDNNNWRVISFARLLPTDFTIGYDSNFRLAAYYYKQAIDRVGNYAPAFNGLGNLWRKKKMYPQAIHFYRRALYYDDIFYFPAYYLGDCQRAIEQHDLAIKYYNRAREINPAHPYTYYGLGRTCYELGNRNAKGRMSFYLKAIENLNTAIDKNQIFARPYLDKARSLEKMSELLEVADEARQALVDARKCYRDAQRRFHDSYYQELINESIKNIKQNIKFQKKLNQITENSKPQERILKYTISPGIENQALENQKSFDATFLSPFTVAKRSSVYLDILKRWNSYTPMLGKNSKGGGYFLRINHTGIVIDPGFNYIENFKAHRHIFKDIDIVLVTHSHDDHTADLEKIINLLYRYNKQLEEKVVPRDTAKAFNTATNKVSTIVKEAAGVAAFCEPEDTLSDLKARYERKPKFREELNKYYEKAFSADKDSTNLEKRLELVYRDWKIYNYYQRQLEEKKKQIRFFVSDGVFNKYKGIFEADKHCNRCPNATPGEISYYVETIETTKYSLQTSVKTGFNIKPIKACHEDKALENPILGPLGFVIEFKNNVLIYTGDTGWNKDIKQQYLRIKNKYDKEGPAEITLLAHLGGFKPKERDFLKTGKLFASCYKNHLGRLGLVELVELLEPSICIVSEFGEEFRDLRIEIAERFNEVFKNTACRTKLIPADIGLNIKFERSKTLIRAISAIDKDSKSILYQYIEAGDLKVGEFRKHTALFYYRHKDPQQAAASGPAKMVAATENNCLQAFFENYIEDELKTVKNRATGKKPVMLSRKRSIKRGVVLPLP